MPDIYSPSVTGSRRIMDTLTQGAATGRIPSKRYIDDIINAELDAAYRNRNIDRAFTEGARQFDIGQQTARETAEATRKASMVGSLANVATTGGMLYALRPTTPSTPPVSPTTPPSTKPTGVSATGIPTAQPVVAPAVTGATGLYQTGFAGAPIVVPPVSSGITINPFTGLPQTATSGASPYAVSLPPVQVAGETALTGQVFPSMRTGPVLASGVTGVTEEAAREAAFQTA